MKYQYAITLVRTRGEKTEQVYQDKVANLERLFNGKMCLYRYETTKGLHLHGIFRCWDAMTIYNVNNDISGKRIYGWSIRAIPIYNLAGWTRYVTKEDQVVLNLSDAQADCLNESLQRCNDEYTHRALTDFDDSDEDSCISGETSDIIRNLRGQKIV